MKISVNLVAEVDICNNNINSISLISADNYSNLLSNEFNLLNTIKQVYKKNSFKSEEDIINLLANEKSNHQIELIKELSNKEKEGFEREISNLRSIVENKKSTVQKGIEAEISIFKHLGYYTKYSSSTSIVNTTSIPMDGDIQLKYKNLNCCIEVKNFNIPVNSSNIEKFHKSVNLNKYNSGIIISMKTNYIGKSNINDMDIKVINKKPIIYIANYIDNTSKLDIAISALTNLLEYLDIANTLEINTYISTFKQLYTDLEESNTHLLTISKSVDAIKSIISKNRINIENIIHISKNYTSNCGKIFLTKSGFNKHSKICTLCKTLF